MRREPLSPDDRAMKQAAELRRNTNGVEQEAFVSTLLAVPQAKRSAFTHGNARAAGRNAAIESTVLSVSGVVEAVPTYPSTANEFEAGWNAAVKRVLDDISRLRGALAASRRKDFTTKAKPETLLSDGTFTEAVYRLWALTDLVDCEWDAEAGKCTRHPGFSAGPRECDHDEARDFLKGLGLDIDDEEIPVLWREARDRRDHAAALAAELPEEGDADAREQ